MKQLIVQGKNWSSDTFYVNIHHGLSFKQLGLSLANYGDSYDYYPPRETGGNYLWNVILADVEFGHKSYNTSDPLKSSYNGVKTLFCPKTRSIDKSQIGSPNWNAGYPGYGVLTFGPFSGRAFDGAPDINGTYFGPYKYGNVRNPSITIAIGDSSHGFAIAGYPLYKSFGYYKISSRNATDTATWGKHGNFENYLMSDGHAQPIGVKEFNAWRTSAMTDAKYRGEYTF